MTEVDRETWDEIQRELREGTPDTPHRRAMIQRADEIYRRHREAALEAGWKEFQRITYSPLPQYLGGYTPSDGAFKFAARVALDHYLSFGGVPPTEGHPK